MKKKLISGILPLIFFTVVNTNAELLFKANQPWVPEIGKTAPAKVPSNLQSIDLKVKWGMTLEKLLRKAKINRQQTHALIQAMEKIYNPRKIRAGDRLQILKDGNNTLYELRYQPTPELVLRARRDSTGNFIALADTLPVQTEQAYVRGEIKTTLYDAILQIGESPELIMAFSDIFQWDIDFFIDPRIGDRFYILFEKQYVFNPQTRSRRFIRYGPILAAAYEKSDTTLTAFSFPDRTGHLRYFDANGRSFQKTFLKSPLNYRRITSYFTTRRRHPILKRIRAHRGVDFAAPTGTPVVAAADGRIILLGWNGGYGKCIKISHKNGQYVTLYGHLSRYARKLRKGSFVTQGQVIGYVGATGLATGPHLHYTMLYNGIPINPLKIRPLSGKPIPANEKKEFFTRQEILAYRLGLKSTTHSYSSLFPEEGMAR